MSKEIIKLIKSTIKLFNDSIKEQGVKKTCCDKAYVEGLKQSINCIEELNKLKK